MRSQSRERKRKSDHARGRLKSLLVSRLELELALAISPARHLCIVHARQWPARRMSTFKRLPSSSYPPRTKNNQPRGPIAPWAYKKRQAQLPLQTPLWWRVKAAESRGCLYAVCCPAARLSRCALLCFFSFVVSLKPIFKQPPSPRQSSQFRLKENRPADAKQQQQQITDQPLLEIGPRCSRLVRLQSALRKMMP